MDQEQRCFGCGEPGHIKAHCPQATAGQAAYGDRPAWPDWCGDCNPRTRLVDHGDYMQRCRACHPLRGRELPQHQRCGGCGQRVYAWDVAPCGKHQPLAIDHHGHRQPVELAGGVVKRRPEQRELALQQVAESRRERAWLEPGESAQGGPPGVTGGVSEGISGD